MNSLGKQRKRLCGTCSLGRGLAFCCLLAATVYPADGPAERVVDEFAVCLNGTDCDDGQLCTVDVCTGGGCCSRALKYGDINADGFVTADDVICLLRTISGFPNSSFCQDPNTGQAVPFQARDIFPCPTPGDPGNMGDGFITIEDVAAVMCVFAGFPTPCGMMCPGPGAGGCTSLCTADAQCEDGLFCNGDESCVNGFCQSSGGGGCTAPTPICDDASDSCVSASPGAVLELVPVVSRDGAVGTGQEIWVEPGDVVLVELRVRGWSGNLLKTVQGKLDAVSLSSGSAGSLSIQDQDLDNNGACDFPAALCPTCGPPLDLDGVFADACRKRCNNASGSRCNPSNAGTCPGEGGILACLTGYPDHFGQMAPLSGAVTGTSNTATLTVASGGTNCGAGAADDGNAHYAGSFVLATSPDAAGTFTVSLDGSWLASYVRNQSDGLLTPAGLTLVDALIHVACDDHDICTADFFLEETSECVSQAYDRYGDMNSNCFVDLVDVLCPLDTFAGLFSSPACADDATGEVVPYRFRDFYPCPGCSQISPGVYDCNLPPDTENMGDGFVNLEEVLVLLDVFAGAPVNSICECFECTAEQVDVSRKRRRFGVTAERWFEAPQAVMSVVPARRRVRPGEEVSVDVYVSGAVGLRGYQVGLDAIGLNGGQLELESVFVDPDHPSYLFAGIPTYQAVNRTERRLLNTAPYGDVEAKEPVYLATFNFLVSEDARGAFRLSVSPHDTMLRNSASEPITAGAEEALILVSPLAARVGR